MKKFNKVVSALLAGLLFGSGLVLSGMTNPAAVLAFLDIGGAWNPALAVVMVSAIAVAAPFFYLVRRRGYTMLNEPAELKSRRPVDAQVLIGSAIFGIGWGLSGICPGPGLIIATSGLPFAIGFVLFMSFGMVAGRYTLNKMKLRGAEGE